MNPRNYYQNIDHNPTGGGFNHNQPPTQRNQQDDQETGIYQPPVRRIPIIYTYDEKKMNEDLNPEP